ncbi:MAG: nucleotidyltransferase family protein [Candidatus Scalindua sp.]|nr:nucleotidyltransferase family protein [Candidatus Scalindua sp.]
MNLSHENKLLLYCAQTEIPAVIRNRVKELIKLPLSWEEILESASWHGISPLLYNNLKGIQETECIPPGVMGKLRAAYHGNLARNMYLYTELKRILEAFHEKRIKVIVLKGAALAKIVYGDIGLRPMSDIDLLVKKEDLPCAEKIISELGYLFEGIESPEWYRINHQEICYIHPKNNIPVEIHWHITNKSHPFRIRSFETDIIERWWEGAKTTDFSGSKAFTLCPEDLIFHLCLHFLKHRFISQNGAFSSKGAFLQTCDIFQTLKHYGKEGNWERLACKAKEYGISNPIYATLFIVREFVGKHDDIVHNVLSKFASVSLDKEIVRLINKRILIRESDLTIVPHKFIQSQATHSFKEKAETLLSHIFPNPESISNRHSIPLSSKRLYLYYLIRPFNLLLKYGKIIFVISRIKEDVILKRWIGGKNENL